MLVISMGALVIDLRMILKDLVTWQASKHHNSMSNISGYAMQARLDDTCHCDCTRWSYAQSVTVVKDVLGNACVSVVCEMYNKVVLNLDVQCMKRPTRLIHKRSRKGDEVKSEKSNESRSRLWTAQLQKLAAHSLCTLKEPSCSH